jgi:hypothetical protein
VGANPRNKATRNEKAAQWRHVFGNADVAAARLGEFLIRIPWTRAHG